MSAAFLPEQVTLFYDEQCAMCRTLTGYIKRKDRSHSITLKPLNGETGQGMRLVWIDKAGLPREVTGAECLPELLKRLPGWQLLTPVFGLPGVSWMAALAYRLIAQNRYKISWVLQKINPALACNDEHCQL